MRRFRVQTRKIGQNDKLIDTCDVYFAFMQINDNVTATHCKYRDCINSLANIDDSLAATHDTQGMWGRKE